MDWREVSIRKCTTGYIVTVRKFECLSTVYKSGGYTHTSVEEHVFENFDGVRDYLDMIFNSERGNK